MVRIKIRNDKVTGLQETVILPGKVKNLDEVKVGGMVHLARGGRVLVSIDTTEGAVHYCDPSVMVEHKLGGFTQRFRGNFISLMPV